jgi:dipeptidase D
MSNDVRNLEPKAMWGNFADLNAVPRPSKKEERVIQFIKDFGASLNLKTIEDEVGNVIIKKPASPGMENRATIVLQSHLDMVHQKNNDTNFDFDTQGIDMYVDGDWVKAKGTTLGADNGIGVASIMALLASKDIAHPAMEALFTIDEETGMTGAMGLKGGLLDASIMLNLDTEDDDELTIGCAGGIDVTATGKYNPVSVPDNKSAFKLTLNGLSGGHSGMDIHRGLGNANKLMARVLMEIAKQVDLNLSSIDGGGLRNAIPREANATILVNNNDTEKLKVVIQELTEVLKLEHSTTDPNLKLQLAPETAINEMLSPEFQKLLLSCVRACPNGIYRMSPDIAGLVQTSNNVARVLVANGNYSIQCLTRSAVDSEKFDLAEAIRATFQLMGATVEFTGSYPGWTPRPGSAIVSIMGDLYTEMFSGQAKVNACHAGLECGILGTNYPKMEMISFGPNIRGAHSPDEKVQISSVQKYWKFLLETLKRIPERA